MTAKKKDNINSALIRRQKKFIEVPEFWNYFNPVSGQLIVLRFYNLKYKKPK